MTRPTPATIQRAPGAASRTIPANGTVSLTHSGVRWTVPADVADFLFGENAPRWQHLDQEPCAIRVKTGFHRVIWQITLPQCPLFAKVFTGRGWLDRLKAQWGLSNGQREWRNARRAFAMSVPVARPLALGVSTSAPVTVIYACEAFVGGVTLPEAWCAQSGMVDSRRLRNRLIDAIASLYAAAHRAGLNHLDGHPNNVLVRCDGADGFSARLIDLAWARVGGRALDMRASAASLAQLDHYFRRLATKPQRLRFLRAYHAERLAHESASAVTDRRRPWLDAIEQARVRHAARLANRRDRRLFQTGKYFARITLGHGWSGVFALKLARRHVFDLGGVEDRTVSSWQELMTPWVAPGGGISVGGGRSACAAPVTIHSEQAGGMFARLRWSVFGSPARRRFLDAHRRRHRDEPAPLILGYAEQRRFGLVAAALTVHPS